MWTGPKDSTAHAFKPCVESSNRDAVLHKQTCTPWTSTPSYALWQQLVAVDDGPWDRNGTNTDKHLLSLALQQTQGLRTICQLLGAIHCSPSGCTIRSCHRALLGTVPFCSKQHQYKQLVFGQSGQKQVWVHQEKQESADHCQHASYSGRSVITRTFATDPEAQAHKLSVLHNHVGKTSRCL